MNEKIFAKGKLFELVHVEQNDGRVFEIARQMALDGSMQEERIALILLQWLADKT